MTSTPFMTADALLQHWQGHRRLTRRVDAFPDDRLFSFSIGGMRTFGAMALEMLAMAVPTIRGVISDEWIPLHAFDAEGIFVALPALVIRRCGGWGDGRRDGRPVVMWNSHSSIEV